MEYKKLITLSYTDEKEYKKVYDSRIKNECAQILDIEISGSPAFYLANNEILMLITEIAGLDKKLTAVTQKLPRLAVERYAAQILIDEIKQTNDIENVYSTKKQIKATFEKIEKNEFKGRFNGLIRKYGLLAKGGEIPLNGCEDLRRLYDETVLPEVVEEDATARPDGILFRKESVSVYSGSGKEIHVGVLPEQKIISMLSAALKILNDGGVNPLVSSAIFHYLFAYVHPFYDGNGRTNRLISSYYISKYLNPLAAYRFSYVIKKHKSRYYKMFSDTNDKRNKGDLTPFIIGYLEFIAEAEAELLEEMQKNKIKYEYYKARLKEFNLSDTDEEIAADLLISALFDTEGRTVTRLEKTSGKSYNTVKKAINKLQSVNILRKTAAGKEIFYEIDLDKFD